MPKYHDNKPKICPECGADPINEQSTGMGDIHTVLYACATMVVETPHPEEGWYNSIWKVVHKGSACEPKLVPLTIPETFGPED